MIIACTVAERPDLAEHGVDSSEVWPEYNRHGDVVNQWWSCLWEELADLQLLLVDDERRRRGRGPHRRFRVGRP